MHVCDGDREGGDSGICSPRQIFYVPKKAETLKTLGYCCMCQYEGFDYRGGQSAGFNETCVVLYFQNLTYKGVM